MDNSILQTLKKHRSEAIEILKKVKKKSELEKIRIKFLGKKGIVTQAKQKIRDLKNEEKPLFGKIFNEVRSGIEFAIKETAQKIETETETEKYQAIDFSMPAPTRQIGTLHPISKILDKSILALRQMGFSLETGATIETEWRCFDALNTPPDHPARNEKDTFYFEDKKLLRTHTSSVQVEVMEKASKLPIRIIAPGSVFRRDEIDATHMPQFTQLEGLFVASADKQICIGDLKGTLAFFFRSIFGSNTEIRMRPHFFPFTEPSYEIDVKLNTHTGKNDWIEIAGCGMVDPAVFEKICQKRGDDLFAPEEVTGFAFGLGIDRLAMVYYGIPDIRFLIENDIRFLSNV